jgi:hypothetical protein
MTDIPAQGADPPIRASDAERDQTLELLRRHFADGRLTLAELEERVAGACEARTQAQLRALTADLPPDLRAPTAQAAGPDWRILGPLLWLCPPAGLAYWLLSRH